MKYLFFIRFICFVNKHQEHHVNHCLEYRGRRRQCQGLIIMCSGTQLIRAGLICHNYVLFICVIVSVEKGTYLSFKLFFVAHILQQYDKIPLQKETNIIFSFSSWKVWALRRHWAQCLIWQIPNRCYLSMTYCVVDPNWLTETNSCVEGIKGQPW